MAAARVLTALACACALAPIAAGASAPTVDVRLARALDVRGVSAATSAAMAVDLQTGEAVFAENPDLPLEPASNEKLAVTYAALHDLGPTYRFRTELLGEGHRAGDVWEGSLVLKGFGDPTLSSADLLQLVHTLRERGIRRVTGFVVGDASWFDSRVGVAGWQPGFAGYQSPLLSALEVDGGWTGNHQARNPPLAAAARLDELLRSDDVPAREAKVGAAVPSAVVLGTVYSAPLADVVEYMIRYSDNFRAEMILKEIGAEVAGVGSSAAGAAIVRRDLTQAGIPMAGVRIVDGSGLSYSDRATARELAALLVTLWHDPSMRAIVWAGLPLAGVSGTLEYRLRTGAAHERVRAKTGTTDIASALSGYVRRSLAFSVLQNGDPVNWTAARKAQDQFVQALANLG
jgi:D-alanyl-D-alanine carboxypeptidase/D-alanyl-D-alanine-endopeptidase (penicillin-binding protein 4)